MAAWEPAAQSRIEEREIGRGNDIGRGYIGWGGQLIW
jgi:hypothetical protein